MTDEWIKKTWYAHAYTHAHSGILAIKRNGIRPFAVTWMYLEIIIPSEVTQRKTNIR